MEKEKASRVFIADPSLRDWMGHHAAYDMALAEAIKRNGSEACVLGNRSMDFSDAAPPDEIIPVFSHDAWGKRTSDRGEIARRDWPFWALGTVLLAIARCVLGLARKMRGGRRRVQPLRAEGGVTTAAAKEFLPPFVRDVAKRVFAAFDTLRIPHCVGWLCCLARLAEYYELLAVLRKKRFGGDDILFAHMITGANFAVWSLVADRIARKKDGGNLVLLYRYPAHVITAPRRPPNGFLARMVESAFEAGRGRVRGATDSLLLAKEYAAFMAVPLAEFPIPHLPRFSERQRREGEPLCCVSLGNARGEKGILDIFDAVRMLENESAGGRFLFKLQINNPDPDVAPDVELFASEAHPQTVLYRETLTPGEYSDLLDGADVVLVPYHHEIYASRTSGVLFEAMAAGKTVLTTRGSWMDKEYGRYGGNAVLVESHSPSDIAEKLVEMEANFPERSAAARLLSGTYRARHGGDAFFRRLLGSAEPEPKGGEKKRRQEDFFLSVVWEKIVREARFDATGRDETQFSNRLL